MIVSEGCFIEPLELSHGKGFFVAELNVPQVEGHDGLAQFELPRERPEHGALAAGQLAFPKTHDGLEVCTDDVLPDAPLVLVALVRERQKYRTACKNIFFFKSSLQLHEIMTYLS